MTRLGILIGFILMALYLELRLWLREKRRKGLTQYRYYLVDKTGTVRVDLGSTAELNPHAPSEIQTMWKRGALTFQCEKEGL